ncbi:hypothetical protein M426DRAFT_42847, partial [Hypoxylon sp. CI-4A]
MYNRGDSVRDAEFGTFEWILGEDYESQVDEELTYEMKQKRRRVNLQCTKEEIQHTRQLRLQTRSTFLEWLSTGNQIFHISGQAGSGKSTLMKLLGSHSRARKELDKWSGNKKLVFAQFFAWTAGSDSMQYSLHGLCRSILFTVLKQCPELIPEVFPDAYCTILDNKYERHIDEPLFRLPVLREALKKLTTISPNRKYCFCILIDGLDEFQGNSTSDIDHYDLAHILTSWAKNDNVKLLVSSRPYDAFMSTFPSESRIELHRLTTPDIMRYGRRKFEENNSFDCVKDCYIKLVDEVVENSQGVFL